MQEEVEEVEASVEIQAWFRGSSLEVVSAATQNLVVEMSAPLRSRGFKQGGEPVFKPDRDTLTEGGASGTTSQTWVLPRKG